MEKITYNKDSQFRDLAKLLANNVHQLILMINQEPLDGDQTEEISVMFREELDLLNGNMTVDEYNKLRGLE